jgi:2-iminoacetate synthase ThiH
MTSETVAVQAIAEKVGAGGRISADEAAVLWHQASDDEMRRLAGLVRARYHEPDRATYMVMRIINYTNVCVAQCDYCAFYVLPNQEGGYVLTREDVFAKIDELLESAATWSVSTGASTRSSRCTTTATCSVPCGIATATAQSSTRSPSRR